MKLRLQEPDLMERSRFRITIKIFIVFGKNPFLILSRVFEEGLKTSHQFHPKKGDIHQYI